MCAHALRVEEEEEEEHSVDLFAEGPPLALHEREWTAVDVGGPTSLLVEPRQAEVWGSALLLARWLMQRPDTVRGRHVAELGAGVGLPSLTAALCEAASVVVTDYDAFSVAAAARAAAHNCALNPAVAALGLAHLLEREDGAAATTEGKAEIARLPTGTGPRHACATRDATPMVPPNTETDDDAL